MRPHKDTGALYLYKKGAGGWRYTSKFVAKKSMPDDKFGWSIGGSNDIAIVGTPNYDARGQESGAVFIQDLNCANK